MVKNQKPKKIAKKLSTLFTKLAKPSKQTTAKREVDGNRKGLVFPLMATLALSIEKAPVSNTNSNKFLPTQRDLKGLEARH